MENMAVRKAMLDLTLYTNEQYKETLHSSLRGAACMPRDLHPWHVTYTLHTHACCVLGRVHFIQKVTHIPWYT